jgi:hypothetical protein
MTISSVRQSCDLVSEYREAFHMFFEACHELVKAKRVLEGERDRYYKKASQMRDKEDEIKRCIRKVYH